MLPATLPTGCTDGGAHFACVKVLSAKAITVILRAIEGGRYNDREDEREPPFMAPSADPNDYSLVRCRCRRLAIAYHPPSGAHSATTTGGHSSYVQGAELASAALTSSPMLAA